MSDTYKKIAVKGKGSLNQKHQVFGDKRTKRNRTRAAQNKRAIEEYR